MKMEDSFFQTPLQPSSDQTLVNGLNGAEDIPNETEIISENIDKNDNAAMENNQIESMKFSTEYSFATFWNWFLPTCLDCWSSPSLETIVAYGSRSFLFLADISPEKEHQQNDESSNKSACPGWKIQYRDLVNVFDFKVKNRHVDRFRSVNIFISTAVFEKTVSMLSDKKSFSGANGENSLRIFLGTNDANAAVYDVYRRTTLLQDLTFSVIKLPCCRNVCQRKIISAAWLRFTETGSTVFYSLDTHIVVWSVERDLVTILHDNNEPCGSPGSRLGSGQLQIACLASLPAECTSDKSEHKLAVGYMGGRICIFGFDPINGQQKSLTIFSDNGHGDDICSLSFAYYSLASVSSAFKQSVLCSISRNSTLKVWSCSQQCEIAEFRINPQVPPSSAGSSGKYSSGSSGGGGGNSSNWFSAVFLPRSTINKLNAYEIMVSNGSGEMLTIAIPAKEINSKLRISKAFKFSSSNNNANPSLHHSSIVFSIAVSHRQLIAISCSLDYRLLVWCLRSRTPATLLHSFSNGTLSIDTSTRDKRVAIAFGNSVFVLDFTLKPGCSSEYDVHPTHYNISIPNSKTTKFYEIRWNRSDSESQLGQLVLGTSNGDVFYYDIASKSFLYKSTKWKSDSNQKDGSKIYKICWSVKFPVPARVGKQPQQQSSSLSSSTVISSLSSSSNSKSNPLLSTVAISLHQSGKIMVNFLRMPENYPQKAPESIEKYIDGIPNSQYRKQSAIDISDDQKLFLLGNDDGTVDVLKVIEDEDTNDDEAADNRRRSTAIYRHLFRFRAFTKPIISMQICNKTKWLSVTALHCNWIHCYNLEPELNPIKDGPIIDKCEQEEEEASPELSLDGDSQQTTVVEKVEQNSDEKFAVKSIGIKRKLTGHEDRVCATCWSPFNEPGEMGLSETCLLASASYDSTCIVWDVPSQTPLRCFFGHKSLVYTIRWCHFNPDFLFSGGEDNFHFWNWTKQPQFVPKLIDKIFEKNFLLKTESVYLKRKQLKAAKNDTDESSSMDVLQSSETVSEEIAVSTREVSSENLKKSSKSKKSLTVNSNSATSTSTTIKALLPFSNQVENNSSKFEILNDIKWIYKFFHKLNGEDVGGENCDNNNDDNTTTIPEPKLDRILIYCNSMEYAKRFLQLELDYHRKNGCPEASYMVSMFSDPNGFIERSIESNSCDLFMANIAAGLSYRLWQSCIRSCTGPDKDGNVGKIRSRSTYNTEMAALLELYSLHDFKGAIESLLRQHLYREALVLATINRASHEFVNDLMDRWHRQRLAQGNYEGAVKCLVASKQNAAAISILEQRRTLCTDTSSSSMLKQYDEVIQLLKGEITSS